MYRPAYKKLSNNYYDEMMRLQAEVKLLRALRCDYCDKTQYEVKQLIAGRNKVHICNECVAVCVDIINEKEKEEVNV